MRASQAMTVGAFCCVIATVSVSAPASPPASLPATDPISAGDRNRCHARSTAYAIPHATSVADPDRPHIRIRCASGGPPCVVFVECGDQEQDADYFCAELESIEDRGTVHLSRNDLAKANGHDVSDGVEELSCHVLSNDPVEVRVLMRTRGYLAPQWMDDPR